MELPPWAPQNVINGVSPRYFKSVSSEMPPTLSPTVSFDSHTDLPGAEPETFGLIAPILDFVGGNEIKREDRPLSEVLAKKPSEIMNRKMQLNAGASEKTPFRWIHIPVNKMDWAQKVVENVLEDAIERHHPDSPESLSRLSEFMFKDSYWKLQRRGIEKFHPLYAQYLQPNFWRWKGNNYTLFMPYLHWDSASSHMVRRQVIKWVDARRPEQGRPVIPDEPEYIESKLAARYLRQGGPLHVRRTLDQFYYDTQRETDEMDDEQVVFKYTTKHRDTLQKKETSMMMVDQLWIWVLKDAGTVVTSFPSMFAKGDKEKGEGDIRFRGSDLFHYIYNDLLNDSMPNRELATSPLDLALTIVKKASGIFVSRTLPFHRQFFFFYENEIAAFAWRQTQLWNDFREKAAEKRRRAKRKNTRNNQSKSTENDQKLLDISGETRLVTSIRDIIDELNIISLVIFDQKKVIEEFQSYILSEEPTKRHPLSYVEKVVASVEKMKYDARREFSELKDLLDLKQKQASVIEAVAAREEAAETVTQGKTILLFTVVTVIFLPPTFFTSVFGMNLQAINQMEVTTIVAVTVPLSLFLIAALLFMAFYNAGVPWQDFGEEHSSADDDNNLRRDSIISTIETRTRRRASSLSLFKTRSSGLSFTV